MEISQLEFELARLEDESAVLNMMKDFYAIDQYPFDYARNKLIFENLLTHPEWGLIWIVRCNNQPISYFILTYGYSFEYGGKDAMVDELYIVEGWRNKGLGTQILQFIEKEALYVGVKTLHLEVEETNTTGLKLYKKNGYVGKDRKFLSKFM